MKLSPQQQIIVSTLRDLEWHCQTEWLGRIKDDRRRIVDLNRGHMLEKGWRIVGKPCDGRCGKNHSSGLFMRRAERIPKRVIDEKQEIREHCKNMVAWFDSLPENV